MRAVLIPSLLSASIPAIAFAQAASDRPAFDVVSIRRNTSAGGFAANPPMRGGRMKFTNVTLKEMLTAAYPVDLLHIRGGPEWANTDTYDVEATSSELPASEDRYRRMLRAMFADRFKLSVHIEQRQEPIYSLIVDRKGLKLRPTPPGTCVPIKPDDPPPRPANYCGQYSATPTHLEGTGMTLAKLADYLGLVVGSRVVDKTGTDALFDIRLDFARDPAGDTTAPSVFTAVEDQLGLRLESRKGFADVLVIDHVERPSEN